MRQTARTPFEIPLAGSYNTRTSATNALSSSSGVIGVGIIGIMIIGKTGVTTAKDQRFVNCYTETITNPFTGKKTFYLVKRPGFASHITPQTGSIGNAIIVWSGSGNKLITAFGATNSSIYDSSTQLVTNNADTTVITGKARSITETTIGTTATITIASSDSTGWYYQPSGTVTKIADGDYPGNAGLSTVGGFAHLNGYAYIMDSLGRIWNSDLNSITAWTSTSFISANAYPDAGIGVVRFGDKIVAFGTESTQFFNHADNRAGSPLARVDPMTLRIGCISADAITEMDDVLYWVGSSPQSGIRIYAYGNQGLRPISTPEVEKILLLAGAGNISLTSLKFNGRSFVIAVASTITYVYCVEENAWHEWAGNATLWYKCAGVPSGSSQVVYSISKQSTSGKVFTINPATMTYQDNGLPFSLIVQTSRIGNGNKRIFWHEIEVIGDKQASSCPVAVSYTDDDYQTYTLLGTVDMADDRPRLTPCGSAYRRAWVLTNSSNTPCRIELLAGMQSEGTH